MCKATRKTSARNSSSDSRTLSGGEDSKRTLIATRKEATPETAEGRGTPHVTVTTAGSEAEAATTSTAARGETTSLRKKRFVVRKLIIMLEKIHCLCYLLIVNLVKLILVILLHFLKQIVKKACVYRLIYYDVNEVPL